jgi:probable rRNA maturation factor
MRHPEPLVLFRSAPSGLRRRPLEAFAHVLRRRVTGGQGFHCLVAGDRELRRLNREFLGRDYAADVLSFPAAKEPQARMPAPPSLGELAISGERAAAQARQFGHSVSAEIRILMLHGVLHLLGMDHERDRGAMARAEMDWRRELGLPSGLIERVRA